MDPIGYAEQSLPKIEYHEKLPSKTFAIFDNLEYEKFEDEFIDYVGGDCHAIVVNDEIIINSYKQKSYRERLIDDSIRNNIIDNPHSLFVKLFRENKKARVILYMFGHFPWFLVIHYRPDFLTMEYYNSTKYIEKYEAT